MPKDNVTMDSARPDDDCLFFVKPEHESYLVDKFGLNNSKKIEDFSTIHLDFYNVHNVNQHNTLTTDQKDFIKKIKDKEDVIPGSKCQSRPQSVRNTS